MVIGRCTLMMGRQDRLLPMVDFLFLKSALLIGKYIREAQVKDVISTLPLTADLPKLCTVDQDYQE
jgi:hypothetical protein